MSLEISDGVPSPTAGIQSIKCECGWESCYITPEEDGRMVVSLMAHITACHRKDLPTFLVTTH